MGKEGVRAGAAARGPDTQALPSGQRSVSGAVRLTLRLKAAAQRLNVQHLLLAARRQAQGELAGHRAPAPSTASLNPTRATRQPCCPRASLRLRALRRRAPHLFVQRAADGRVRLLPAGRHQHQCVGLRERSGQLAGRTKGGGRRVGSRRAAACERLASAHASSAAQGMVAAAAQQAWPALGVDSGCARRCGGRVAWRWGPPRLERRCEAGQLGPRHT
jgi:hypothetical protein